MGEANQRGRLVRARKLIGAVGRVFAPNQKVDANLFWSGECRRCQIVWWWPREGHKFKADLPRAKCPQCQGSLNQINYVEHDDDRVVERADMGLTEE